MSTRAERRRMADEYQQAGKEFIKKQYEDDRTPFVKKIDIIGKFLAALLSILFFINLQILVNGGGYEYEKIVPVIGTAEYLVGESALKDDIEDETMLFLSTGRDAEIGDIVVFGEEKNYQIAKIESQSSDLNSYILTNDKTDKETVSKEKIVGIVSGKTKSFAGLIKFYRTSLGAVVNIFLVFFLLILPDILMFKKRKAQVEKERERLEKKREALREKGDTVDSKPVQKPKVQEKIDERKEKKNTKVKQDTEHISKEMAELRRKMAQEEAELDRKMNKK